MMHLGLEIILTKKKKKTTKQTGEAIKIEVPELSPAAATPKWVNLAILGCTAFMCGCLVMVLELTSTRLLAPFFGNTIYCWTGIIGMILFALSVGYLIGGVLADKYEQRIYPLLLVFLGMSALFTALIPLFGNLLLRGFLARQSIAWGPIIGTLAIFFLPALFFSTIPPICVKAISQNLKLVGLSAGLISSISALGSIIGTFATGFYLIPTYRLATIYLISALIIVLLMASIVLIQQHRLSTRAATVVLMLLLIGGGYSGAAALPFQDVFPDTGAVYRQLTPYHLIRVYDKKDHYMLMLDSTNEGAMAKNGKDLVFEYTKFWELIKCWQRPGELRRVCFIGGGAFAMPTLFSRQFPETRVDVVEIDPNLIPLARKYFQLSQSDNFHTYAEDGRRWFLQQQRHYDFIFLDAFRGPKNVPFHLVTKEYFAELKASLDQNGILAMNLISARSGQEGKFYRSLVKGLLQNFPLVLVFAPQHLPDTFSCNQILFCLKNQQIYDHERSKSKSAYYHIEHLYNKLVRTLHQKDLAEFADAVTFTDQYAPVEYMVAQQK